MIKFHVVKEAIQSSSSLPFITNFNLFVNAKTLTHVFQGRNPILLVNSVRCPPKRGLFFNNKTLAKCDLFYSPRPLNRGVPE